MVSLYEERPVIIIFSIASLVNTLYELEIIGIYLLKNIHNI